MPKNCSTKVSTSGKRNNQRSAESSEKDYLANPVDFMVRTMAERDPKKRKVKPNAKSDVLLLDLFNDSSSDDEEYVPGAKDTEDIADESGSDDGEEEDDDNSDESSSNEEEEKDDETKRVTSVNKRDPPKKHSPLEGLGFLNLKEEPAKKANEAAGLKFDIPAKAQKLLVCSICLGDLSQEEDEIVECDSCGITVHEGCYGITTDETEECNSDHSNASSSSTEPWFCDACLANVVSPSCDLCPNTGGIFKQTDVKRWVHLVCALYIPRVAFADTSRLTGITLFELPYERWGARVCSLCEDERLSRTGICISCDAGMCKTYFHVTCAQSHGLLTEAQSAEDENEEIADPFFAHCKVHAGDKIAVKAKRRNWLALQSKLKMRNQHQGSFINDRIQRKLNRARLKWLKNDEEKKLPWVPIQKIPRLLTTSSSAVKKLIKKAELLGMSPQAHYMAAQDLVDVRKKWHIPPAFSVEFISYYLDRNNRMNSMQKRLEELKSQCRQLKSVENSTRHKYEQITDEILSIKSENEIFRCSAQDLLSLLSSFTREKLEVPSFLNIATKINDNLGNETGGDSECNPSIIIQCGLCKQSHDFQKLALCDSCKIHYHLYCLDPPLKRMPKKTRFGGWQCSDCTEKEEESINSPEEDELSRESFEDGTSKRRKLREHVKGPDKFIPDPDFTAVLLSSERKKKSSKKRKAASKKLRKSDPNTSQESLVPLEPTIRRGASSSGGISLLAPEPNKKPVIEDHDCYKCKITSNDKSLVQCDGCFLYYHFGCCNPPVKKTPKRKGYQWFCEECDSDEESDDEDADENHLSDEDIKENGDDSNLRNILNTKENGGYNYEDSCSSSK